MHYLPLFLIKYNVCSVIVNCEMVYTINNDDVYFILLTNCIKIIAINIALTLVESVIIFEITFFEIANFTSKIKIDKIVNVKMKCGMILLIRAVAIYTIPTITGVLYVGISKNEFCSKFTRANH